MREKHERQKVGLVVLALKGHVGPNSGAVA